MTAGKGQLELEGLPVGAYDVTAEYSIDPNAPESQRYADDSNTASFKVTEKPVTTFTVSFDANGGSGKMEKVTGVSGEYTLPECTFTAPDDKAFDCWMVGNDTYAPGDKIAFDADTTVEFENSRISQAVFTITQEEDTITLIKEENAGNAEFILTRTDS